MPPPLAHDLCRNQPHLTKQPTYDRQFKDDSHHKVHHQQCVDIRLNGKHVRHIGAHLISSQKLHRQREDEQIVQQSPHHEHHVTATYK